MLQKRKIVRMIISSLIIVIIFFFMGKSLYHDWSKVSEYELKINYTFLTISIFMGFILHSLLAFNWYLILRKLGGVLSLKKALKISFVSQLGKYLPGKVWIVVGKVVLCNKQGISKKTVFTSAVLENAFIVISGLFLALLFVVNSRNMELNRFLLPSLFFIIAGLVAVYPPIFNKITNAVLVRFKKQQIKVTLNYRNILLFLLYYSMFWTFSGVTFWFFLNSIYSLPFSNIFDITGAIVLSSLAGFLAVFAPAGLGVRDGALAFLLSFYIPAPMAIIISLASRIWGTLSELVLIGIVSTVVR